MKLKNTFERYRRILLVLADQHYSSHRLLKMSQESENWLNRYFIDSSKIHRDSLVNFRIPGSYLQFYNLSHLKSLDWRNLYKNLKAHKMKPGQTFNFKRTKNDWYLAYLILSRIAKKNIVSIPNASIVVITFISKLM